MRMRVLFITATRLGDAVLSTGLLAEIGRRWPDARVTIACGPVAAGLFARMPNLERVIVVDKRPYDLHWVALWRECATTWWDLAIDLRASAVTFLIPARRRAIMRGGRRAGHRLTHLARVLDLPTPPMPVVWTSPEDRALAATLVPDGAQVMAIGPTANWSGKMWPAARFVALFEAVRRERQGMVAALFSGPGDAEHAMAAPVLAGLPPGTLDLRGMLALPEIAAVIARCALFVGNDSGLMHLAAAAGTPTLGLFGPSRVDEYGPSGRLTAAAVAPGPAGAAPIAGLTVAAALAEAFALLNPGAP